MSTCLPALLCAVLSCLVFCGAVIFPSRIHHHALEDGDVEENEVNAANDWDYILFVQRWPASVCVDGHVTGALRSEKCSFPPEMAPNAWLMHGIWPTKTGTVGPVNCIKNATWDIDPVDPLLDTLKEFWSNLEGGAVDSFWEHEWLKHGTCAQSLPALVGEFNFFNIPLTLQQKNYNFYEALASQQIIPDSGRNYSHAEFTAALDSVYGNKAEVWCAFSHDTKEHYIAEIRLCLDKSLALIDCPEGGTLMKNVRGTDLCPTTESLVYPPLKVRRHSRPRHAHRHVF